MTGSGVLAGGFEAALAELVDRSSERAHWLVLGDGPRVPLPVRRWHGPPEPALTEVVRRCSGPTIDLGCGPGRLTAALAERGLVALGVDVSAVAVRLARGRGAAALRRDVLAPLPGEGRWAHALLVDGNIGIGGDPVRLLRRCAGLLRPGGTALVELAPPGAGLWRGRACVTSGGRAGDDEWGPAFRWARVGVELAGPLASAAGFRVAAVLPLDRRWFVELVRR
ncbi:class I SAM-dependent methyltransferase [Micromonospora inositola]|uniref:Methyltransferase domain-containing protein n=1 Tax=Micromonospora inositola TaxID=47865 RepID=A0A1C5GYK5_9ACTN|nr:class I SAM-dependent methyltransferase [Micromonospora inositola]SCG38241.1 Methyltransferase domain-containing protein [Micromonospora inositola]